MKTVIVYMSEEKDFAEVFPTDKEARDRYEELMKEYGMEPCLEDEGDPSFHLDHAMSHYDEFLFLTNLRVKGGGS